jgi:signal transduction histidine kinase
VTPRHSPAVGSGLPTPNLARALLVQIAWFNRLRFLAVIGMSAMTAFAQGVLGVLDETLLLYALAAVTLLVNIGYVAWYPRLRRADKEHLQWHVHLQIGVDLAILTLLLHLSGGITNPLATFYVFHTFIAALLLSLRSAMGVAILSMLLVTGLAFAERYGVVPHWPNELSLFDLQRLSAVALVAWLLAFASTLTFSVYFVATTVRQLRAREGELVRLSRQLGQSEKLASIGTLAAGVSHEINNPVGVILNKAKILRYRIEDHDPVPALLEELDVIEKHGLRIGAITEGLLAFAREAPFELRIVELNKLVREAADLVRVPFQNAEVALAVDFDGAAGAVRGSTNHLLQVFVNILLNARDASPARSTVRLATELLDAGEVAVHVVDSGSGIPAEDLDKIFDPFFTTKDVGRGTGLGLAISHGLVERHEGAIDVESEPGRGSRFTVRLPRLADGVESRASHPRAELGP